LNLGSREDSRTYKPACPPGLSLLFTKRVLFAVWSWLCAGHLFTIPRLGPKALQTFQKMESTKNPLAPLSKKIQTQRHFPYPPFGHPHKTFIHLPFNNSPLLPALLFPFLLLARKLSRNIPTQPPYSCRKACIQRMDLLRPLRSNSLRAYPHKP